ncbi:hypothetical protein N7481_008034 [Penicillium waksmanii]|uniref:uncharacterized protein n=1 Tax=Penicillium waksmanii TaxID=69791 RepID=UPI0025466B4C|nr:uncharacterized protein N7481_008034 [Penicillium waksmanii]KAJ5980736.1 hypothetical protein N7481_008034 [Penicillium waksmanii]
MAAKWPSIPPIEDESIDTLGLIEGFKDQYMEICSHTLKHPTAAAPAGYVMGLMFHANKVITLLAEQLQSSSQKKLGLAEAPPQFRAPDRSKSKCNASPAPGPSRIAAQASANGIEAHAVAGRTRDLNDGHVNGTPQHKNPELVPTRVEEHVDHPMDEEGDEKEKEIQIAASKSCKENTQKDKAEWGNSSMLQSDSSMADAHMAHTPTAAGATVDIEMADISMTESNTVENGLSDPLREDMLIAGDEDPNEEGEDYHFEDDGLDVTSVLSSDIAVTEHNNPVSEEPLTAPILYTGPSSFRIRWECSDPPYAAQAYQQYHEDPQKKPLAIVIDLNKALHTSSDKTLKKKLIKTVQVQRSGDLDVYPWEGANIEYLIQNAQYWFPHLKKGDAARVPGRYAIGVDGQDPSSEGSSAPTSVEQVLPFALRICWKGSRSPYKNWESDRAVQSVSQSIASVLRSSRIRDLSQMEIFYIEHRPEFGDIILYPNSHSEREELIKHAHSWIPYLEDGDSAWLPGFYYTDTKGKPTPNPFENVHFQPSSLLGIACCPFYITLKMTEFHPIAWKEQGGSLSEMKDRVDTALKRSSDPEVAAMKISGIVHESETRSLHVHLNSIEDRHLLLRNIDKWVPRVFENPPPVAMKSTENDTQRRKEDQRTTTPNQTKNRDPKPGPSYTLSKPVVPGYNGTHDGSVTQGPRDQTSNSMPFKPPDRPAAFERNGIATQRRPVDQEPKDHISNIPYVHPSRVQQNSVPRRPEPRESNIPPNQMPLNKPRLPAAPNCNGTPGRPEHQGPRDQISSASYVHPSRVQQNGVPRAPELQGSNNRPNQMPLHNPRLPGAPNYNGMRRRSEPQEPNGQPPNYLPLNNPRISEPSGYTGTHHRFEAQKPEVRAPNPRPFNPLNGPPAAPAHGGKNRKGNRKPARPNKLAQPQNNSNPPTPPRPGNAEQGQRSKADKRRDARHRQKARMRQVQNQ